MNSAMHFLRNVVAILGIVSAFGAAAARAATYNFYFNNAEQGDNSSAMPVVTVGGDGKVEKHPAMEPTPAPSPTPTSAPQKTEARVPRGDFEDHRSHPHWRFVGGAFSAESTSRESLTVFDDGWDPFNDKKKAAQSKSGGGVILEASYFFTPIIGLSLFLGSAAGTEAELSPLHLANDTIELGAMIGLTALGFDVSDKASPHVGARVGLNFARNWGINVVGRITPYKSEDFSFSMIEAGLTFRI